MTAVASAFRLRDGKPEPLPPVHLQGMGVMGALVGQLLVHLGLDFTWSDTQSPHNAWQACTGIIYPSGHALDNQNLAAWIGNEWCCRLWREYGRWTYYSKHPPHGGRGEQLGQVGGVRVSPHHTVHVNAQAMVTDLRAQWRPRRTDKAAPNQLEIVTHGFDMRTINRWSWGWSARVTLELFPELERLCGALRPALYMRDGYLLDYAYPVPDHPELWYAGTALQTQRKPKSLFALAHFHRWTKRFLAKTAGAVTLLAAERPVEGWRPVPYDSAKLIEELDGSTWAIRPQYGSAFRHWWTTAAELTRKLVEARVLS